MNIENILKKATIFLAGTLVGGVIIYHTLKPETLKMFNAFKNYDTEARTHTKALKQDNQELRNKLYEEQNQPAILKEFDQRESREL